MKQLIIFNYGANVAEPTAMGKLTELHFAKLIGSKNIHGHYPIQKDFQREDAFNLLETISGMQMKTNDNIAFAIVCEYPTRNILEWQKALQDTWGPDCARLYIRTTENLSIHPLVVKYGSLKVDASAVIENTDEWTNDNILPKCMVHLNVFGDYEVELPRDINIYAKDEAEYNLAVNILGQITDLTQLDMKYTMLKYDEIDQIVQENIAEDEAARTAAIEKDLDNE